VLGAPAPEPGLPRPVQSTFVPVEVYLSQAIPSPPWRGWITTSARLSCGRAAKLAGALRPVRSFRSGSKTRITGRMCGGHAANSPHC
jgi:hypothetical protein